MGKETLQMEEILEFSTWKYCCGKFYDSIINPNLTILSQLKDQVNQVAAISYEYARIWNRRVQAYSCSGYYFGNRQDKHKRAKEERQYTCNIMAWRVLLPTVAMEKQKCIHFEFCQLIYLPTVNNCSIFPCKCNNGFPLHCCRAAKYYLMLSYYLVSQATFLIFCPISTELGFS